MHSLSFSSFKIQQIKIQYQSCNAKTNKNIKPKNKNNSERNIKRNRIDDLHAIAKRTKRIICSVLAIWFLISWLKVKETQSTMASNRI